MHPAKSVFAFSMGNSIVIGLPGPPNAVNLAFHTIINPVINMLQAKAETSATTPAILTDALKGGRDREKLRPCRILKITEEYLLILCLINPFHRARL